MNLRATKTKSGARKGSGYRPSNYHYYGNGGGGGPHLPVWAYVVIAVGSIWVCVYIVLFFHFFRKDYMQADPLKRRRLGPSLLRAAWKALLCATLIKPAIWASRKLWARFRAGRGAKNVGGTFYRKIEEGEEKGQGGRDINNGGGEAEGAVPLAQERGEPLMSPVKISKGSDDR